MTTSMDTRVVKMVAAARAARPCRAVAAHAYELLDGELAPRVAAAIRDHLDGCVPCRGVVRREQAFLALVARAARVAPAPTGLVARVHEELGRAVWALERRASLGRALGRARGGHPRGHPLPRARR
jgi:mycothiol system anti-sigma-R factor